VCFVGYLDAVFDELTQFPDGENHIRWADYFVRRNGPFLLM
jgi:hypothetical protein